MQQLFLLILFVVALYYLYRKLVKNRGCDCGSKSSCCTTPIPKISRPKDKKPDEQ